MLPVIRKLHTFTVTATASAPFRSLVTAACYGSRLKFGQLLGTPASKPYSSLVALGGRFKALQFFTMDEHADNLKGKYPSCYQVFLSKGSMMKGQKILLFLGSGISAR
jgi:hypothetical protein